MAEKLAAIETIDPADEDVHSSIERQLGDVGRKIHAGRSRNDQVAAAFRLYVVDACREADAALVRFAQALLARAADEATTPMPGYTHLQRAQPVTLGHHLLAWVEMLERDRARFAFAQSQATPSPLGAGALAGSTLPLPAPPNAMRNSIDAVGDRDFALDYLYAVATLFTHLSRIGEELVLWTSREFGFARLPEEAATGSSIMPQKLNPDVAELARGKAGTAIGRLTGLLATVKSLPLAYDRDLQEDKPPVFAARRDTGGALGALTVLVSGLTFVHGRLAAATADPLLRATDAAEALVADGRAVPRRARAGRRPGACRVRSKRRLRASASATWRPRSAQRRSAGHDDAARSLPRGPRLPAHLGSRPCRGGGDPRPRRRAPPQPEAAAPARCDARPLLREALDAHARLVLGRDGAARRRCGPPGAGGAAALARRVAAGHGAGALEATSTRSPCASTRTRSSRSGRTGRRSR